MSLRRLKVRALMNELWVEVGRMADPGEPAFASAAGTPPRRNRTSAVGAPPRRDGAMDRAQRLIRRRVAARAQRLQDGLILGIPS